MYRSEATFKFVVPQKGHLLRARQVLAAFLEQSLRLFAFGDVGDGAKHPNGTARGIAQRFAAALHPTIAAVLAAQPRLQQIGLVLFQMRAQRLRKRSLVVRVEAFVKRRLLVGKLDVAVTKNALPAGRDVGFASQSVPVPNTVVDGVLDQPVALLALLQRRLRLLHLRCCLDQSFFAPCPQPDGNENGRGEQQSNGPIDLRVLIRAPVHFGF